MNEIPAKILLEGRFVVATRNNGIEADLGKALYEASRRNRDVSGIIRTADFFGIEYLAARCAPYAEKLIPGITERSGVIIVPDECIFNGDVFFEYDIRGYKIYVRRVIGDKSSKPTEITKILTELSKR